MLRVGPKIPVTLFGQRRVHCSALETIVERGDRARSVQVKISLGFKHVAGLRLLSSQPEPGKSLIA